MLGWFRKASGEPHGSAEVPRAFGAGPYEWQPSRTVEPFYALQKRDESEFGEFMHRANIAIDWNQSDIFVSASGELSPDTIEADFWWWARIENELWILTENVWAYFPDPLPYSLWLSVTRDRSPRCLGHFALLPSHWTNGPQKVQS